MFDNLDVHINSSLSKLNNISNSLENNSLNLQPDWKGFGSQQLLTLAGETLIHAWQNQTNPTPAMVYAAGSIFKSNFAANAHIAFGEAFNINKAEALGADILGGNYGVLPDVQFLANADMNGALGAYAKSNNTIYLNSAFLTQNSANPTAINKVLVEEEGHFLDIYASSVDSPGDEGEMLAELISGNQLSADQITRIRVEDDTATIVVNGQKLGVEQASLVPIITISATDVNAGETLAGQPVNPGQFTLTRTGSIASALTVNYMVGGTATNGIDYSTLTNSVTFAAGVSTAIINLNPIDDIVIENDETFILNLTSSTNYNLGTATTATVIIADNDKPTITISANDANAGETLAGQLINPGQFTLTRTGNTASALTVNYMVGGTATNGIDYSILTNSVTFAAGASTAIINLNPIDDFVVENDETVILNLASSTNYNLGAATTATVIIGDNDKPTITISANDANARETLAGQPTNPGQFTLTRTGSIASALTVNYTMGGTATNGTDYSTLTNSVTFAAGVSTAIVNVTPIDDFVIENDETVVLNLVSNTNYNLGIVTTATVIIADNDKPTITISATDANAGETLAGQTTNPGQFTLTRTGNVASALTVNYTIAGTATNGTDYSNLSGNATFMAGAATTLVTVIPKDDSVFEGNESVILTLAAGNAYTLGNAQTASVTLMDNDLSTWNVSFINRNDSNYADYNSYDFSRPNATLNLGWQNGSVYDSTPFETLTVDSRTNVAPIGQPKVYSSVLEVGKRYRIAASGTWNPATNTSGWQVDARFYSQNNWTSVAGDSVPSDIGLFSDVLGAGNDDFWGEYRPDHLYTYEIIGNGQRVDFYVSDSDYLNNQGAYTVKIYRESATPPTGNTIRLNANFGERSPALNVQSDNFAMQAWTTTHLENGKTYQVTTNSDDGTRFFVKNLATGEVTSIGSEWRVRSDREPSMTIYFNVAQTGNYDFYVQGYDHLGASAFTVELKETPANSKPNHLGLVTDFNKDGQTDILWKNLSNGEFGAWSMNGTTANWIDIDDGFDKNDGAWNFVGTGDFNNDGNTDIIQRYHWVGSPGYTRIWLMNGNQHVQTVEIEAINSNDWHIAGTGDFNQDGNVDILLRNYVTGANNVWMMRGYNVINRVDLDSMADLNQRIVGTGDFNSDGKIDILWRNAATGDNSIWFMNGVNRASTANFDKVSDLNWHIMGAADFNNDGKSDIIWRNYANGQNLIWLMNGSTHTSDLDIQDTPDRNWTIVGKSDPVGIWTAQYFGNKDLSGTPTYTEAFTDVTGNFSRNWGLGAPPNTPADNFSARYKTERYLAPGLYKINLSSDDGVRIWIGNELIINQWTDQAGNYSDYFTSSGGYYPVTIEYKENGGYAQLNYEIVKYQPYNNFGNPDGIINSWNATFFHWNGEGNPILDDAHKIGTVNLGSNVRGDGQWGMNLQNWGSGSPAPDVPIDFFAMQAYTRRNLTAGNTYEVWVRSDDGYQIFAHKLGGGAFNITPNALNGEWQGGAYGNPVKWTFVAPESGTFDFKINMFEGGGDAYVDLVLKDVTPQGRLQDLANKSGVLSIDEINEYRQLVSQRPESERAQWYTTLQYKTPYFNQRDNGHTSIADVMCNVTTLAACLTFMGVKNPEPNRQFEDVLEDRISSYSWFGTNINPRYWWDNLSALAGSFNVKSSGKIQFPGFSVGNVEFFKQKARELWEPAIRQGKAVMAGVSTTAAGHIVRVLDIDWNRGGIIVDDPFGSAQDKAGSQEGQYCYSGTENTKDHGGVNTQNSQNELGKGNDNFWSWSFCTEVIGGTWYLILGNSPNNSGGSSFISSSSTKGLEFIGQYEGLRLNLYNDPAGHATIGYGHLVHLGSINGSEPNEFKQGITKERALQLLAEDAANAAQAVKDLVKVALNQYQFDALVSFTFNLGRGNLQSSDLLTRLNKGEYDAVPDELNRWVYGGGQKLPGLVRRRQEEGILFRNSIYTGIA